MAKHFKTSFIKTGKIRRKFHFVIDKNNDTFESFNNYLIYLALEREWDEPDPNYGHIGDTRVLFGIKRRRGGK